METLFQLKRKKNKQLVYFNFLFLFMLNKKLLILQILIKNFIVNLKLFTYNFIINIDIGIILYLHFQF